MNDNSSVPLPFIDMSGSNWFWENYNKCFQWQIYHQLALLKAKNKALEVNLHFLQEHLHYLVERNNNLIMQHENLWQVDGVNPPGFLMDPYSFLGGYQDTVYIQPQVDYYNNSSQHYQYSAEPMYISDDGTSSDEEYELSEEYVKFIEISFRHKMEMKKLKEARVKESIQNKEKNDYKGGIVDKKGVSASMYDKVLNLHRKEQRTKEMSLLYGEAAPKIHAMETAIQLSFNRNSDVYQPKLWPQIPFNIDYAETSIY